MNYFVTAIGTDSGKTLVSAILCEALGADYWKPVQSGLPRDTETVAALVSNAHIIFHPERFLLKTPASPHAAAKIDGVTIRLDSFHLPETQNTLVVEGAGGCLVPLSESHLIIDLISRLNLETILVSNLYLGSINHTLLTCEALKKRNLPVRGIIFNGEANEESERIILHYTNLRCLLRIRKEPAINREVVKAYASELKENWYE
ncbi:MAG: dethiobiotin synthase [Bacteroidota bacterium]|nr:dethiobiotin synthase [Bacteroidota bacterium]